MRLGHPPAALRRAVAVVGVDSAQYHPANLSPPPTHVVHQCEVVVEGRRRILDQCAHRLVELGVKVEIQTVAMAGAPREVAATEQSVNTVLWRAHLSGYHHGANCSPICSSHGDSAALLNALAMIVGR